MPEFQSVAKITVALAVTALSLAPVAASANPVGVTYEVKVATSFGTKFSDCFSFDGAGTLTVEGYGPLAYTLEARGRSQSKFQALASVATATSAGFSIQFNGLALGNATQGYMKASGSDEAGDTYQVRGGPVASCSTDKAKVSYRPAS